MTMNYSQAIRELESLGVFPDRVPSLEPTRRALEHSGFLKKLDPSRVVVVAGTNGKGSTCSALDALFRHAGVRAGLYTSPHLVQTTERIRILGEDVSQVAFVEHYERVKPFISMFGLTHFEALTIMAVSVFVEHELDWMVFEIGLGGIWDATNAIPHDHCVMTPIDYDHQNLLGATLVEIAANKFGIVGQGSRVVYAPLASEIQTLQREVRSRTGSEWLLREDFGFRAEARAAGEPHFFISFRGREVRLELAGRRGAENAALALTVFSSLGFNPMLHLEALLQVRWPGRMERLEVPGSPCPVYGSGDHNPQGVESLVALLDVYSRKHTHFILGLGRDKDWATVLEKIAAIPDSSFYLTETPFKGLPIDGYGSWNAKARGSWADPLEALDEVIRGFARVGDLVIVTGSLYLVGKIKAHYSAVSAATPS